MFYAGLLDWENSTNFKQIFFLFLMTLKIRCHKMAVVHLEPSISEGGVKPPTMFKSTLDYPNKMWESAFYIS